MIKLYRAVSRAEKEDYDRLQLFQTTLNTLEAKQFFKTTSAIKEFVANSILRDYDPPYQYLFIITLDAILFENANPSHMKLDGYEAISIDEEYLSSFNNSVTFVQQEEL